MGRKFIDLTGEQFGMLTVDSIAYKKNSYTYWNCSCNCGGIRIVRGDHLRDGSVTDCGCTRKHISHQKENKIYDLRLYRIWSLMKERCFNSKRKEYPKYGGRGITVCEEWLDSRTFIEWAMANGYNDNLTLDRIDNNGNYCPENCRWVTRMMQGNNKRCNRNFTYNGVTKTLSQWSRDSGLPYYVIKKRIDILGWSFERAISEPVHLNYSNKQKGE